MVYSNPTVRAQADKSKIQLATEAGGFSDHLALAKVCYSLNFVWLLHHNCTQYSIQMIDTLGSQVAPPLLTECPM